MYFVLILFKLIKFNCYIKKCMKMNIALNILRLFNYNMNYIKYSIIS